MAGQNHELEGQYVVDNGELGQVPILEIQRRKLIEDTDPDSKADLGVFYGFTRQLASSDQVFGYGVKQRSEQPGRRPPPIVITFIMQTPELQVTDSDSAAYDATCQANEMLISELVAKDPDNSIYPHNRTSCWYLFTNSPEGFDESIHPEPVDESSLSDAERALRDINSALGWEDDHSYTMLVKFT